MPNQPLFSDFMEQRILYAYARGGLNQTELAEHYGCSRRTIQRLLIKHGYLKESLPCATSTGRTSGTEANEGNKPKTQAEAMKAFAERHGIPFENVRSVRFEGDEPKELFLKDSPSAVIVVGSPAAPVQEQLPINVPELVNLGKDILELQQAVSKLYRRYLAFEAQQRQGLTVRTRLGPATKAWENSQGVQQA